MSTSTQLASSLNAPWTMAFVVGLPGFLLWGAGRIAELPWLVTIGVIVLIPAMVFASIGVVASGVYTALRAAGLTRD